MIQKIIFLFNAITMIACSQVCYDDLGCFTNDYPFGGSLRPISDLPDTPAKINTTFYLYTRQSPSKPEIINYKNPGKFNPSLPTKLIVHGWLDTSFEQWILDMRDALLKVEDMNVIAVDWGKGAKYLYEYAVANTQIAGAETARLIHSLIDNTGVSIEKFHIIGHSLGAHVCGYAGKRISGLPHITGLDPASPYFEGGEPVVRLDINDAKFIDVIHTSGYKYVDHHFSIGFLSPVGHVDFYPNGGLAQPGCSLASSCSHLASHRLYIDSIKDMCKFESHPCSSMEDFNKGECLKCGTNGCNRMGYWSTPYNDQKSLYLITQPIQLEMKCKYNFQIVLTSGDMGRKKTKGNFEIVLHTQTDSSAKKAMGISDTLVMGKSVKNILVSLNKALSGGDVTGVTIYFTRNFWDIMFEETWQFKSVEVFSARTQMKVMLCPVVSGRFLVTDSHTVEYKKC